MESSKLFGIAIPLLLGAASALAQGTAQRPGTVRPITADNISSDTATATDFGGWIEWKSNHSGAKTQFIPTCDAKANGAQITVIDGAYNAASNPIDIKVTGESSDINGLPNGRRIVSNGGSIHLVCNGNNNWLVLADNERGGELRIATDHQLMLVGNIVCESVSACNAFRNDPEVVCRNTEDNCSRKVYEDTLRGTDDSGLVIYRSNHLVDVGLPRNEPHSAFAPGWMTKVENDGGGRVQITATRPSKIDGAQTTPDGDSRFTMKPHTVIEIWSGPNLTYEIVDVAQ